ncbi:TlpA family protein disulfide reductase [Aeromicrobium wangtongii]|uniref:TlpA family protein disulfide reductase n=1 Tax=Aeromicrobium wangtongii TaxID=2969247 RepID=A0ABY5M737_9ACTN|nr:TlpA disulfide reductase family protein [Aeromicrobium wangtongii]MCD9199617.1 TlpA family protein disulfide reductase [Aeromicrobium wangtongii]UUP13969.1 TlpA family protein disulfide reductase [Aeromicrobium wangtongii]
MSAAARRTAAALVAAVLALTLAACSSSDPEPAKPTFGGGGAATSGSSDELAAAKARAGIEDCPAGGERASGDGALPDVTLACLGGGRSVELSTLTGTPTVINLWASWCVPCRKELPLLARVDAEYGDRLRVIGIDFKETSPGAAIELARATGVTYPQLSDPDQSAAAGLGVVALPQTIFVDAQGRITATERKEFRSYADLTAAIERHLGVTP